MTAAIYGCGGSSTSDSIPSSVSIFYEHSVVFRNHTTFTMGYNGFGQLGDGTLTKREVATPVPGMIHMTKGVTGVAHTMVTDGTSVYAWGSNLQGQLGDNTIAHTYPNGYKSAPIPVPLPGAATDIAAGGYHSLAIVGGKLYAWGYNLYRQLGSLVSDPNTPNQITTGHEGEDLSALNATKVAAGGLFSMALFDNGDVYAWGNNRDLKSSSPENQLVAFGAYSSVCSSPKKITFKDLTGKIEDIAALASGSLALDVKRDPGSSVILSQTLWGWGYNDAGELGPSIPLLTSSPVPVEVFSTGAAGVDTFVIKKIVTGMNHVMLLMGKRDTLVNDGSWYVQSIGLNAYGQLGNNSTIDSSSFVTVYTALNPEWSAGVSDIAAFGTSSFALVNGVWYGWGNNGIGQLGNRIATDSVAFFETPVTVKFP